VKRRNLVIATFNKGKLQELRQLLSELPFGSLTLRGSRQSRQSLKLARPLLRMLHSKLQATQNKPDG
jgi:inosine/xanthosine triphosphate pyrophosphatase family protein